jgi:hypothetical protein
MAEIAGISNGDRHRILAAIGYLYRKIDPEFGVCPQIQRNHNKMTALEIAASDVSAFQI